MDQLSPSSFNELPVSRHRRRYSDISASLATMTKSKSDRDAEAREIPFIKRAIGRGGSEVRVFLFLDSARVLDNLAMALSADSAISIVGSTNDPFLAISEILRLRPDVIVIHLQDVIKFGRNIVDQVKKLLPALKVVLLSNRMPRHSDKFPLMHADAIIDMINGWRLIPEIVTSMHSR